MDHPQYELMYKVEDAHWWFIGRQQIAFSLIRQRVKLAGDACILDVGCGTGGNLQALAHHGTAIGLDLSPIALDFARRRRLTGLTQASGLTLPYPDNVFDLVTTFDVLYHQWIADDDQALRELFRVIKPGGWLLVTDSALPLLWSAHDEVYYARQRYTLANIRLKLRRAGFEQRSCSYTNMVLLPIVLLSRLIARVPLLGDVGQLGMPPPWLNRMLIRIRTLEAKWVARGEFLPLGSSLVCLCQKPVEAGSYRVNY